MDPIRSTTAPKTTESSLAASREPGASTLVAAAAGGIVGAVVGERVGHTTGSSIAGAALGVLAGAIAAEIVADRQSRPSGIHEVVAYLDEHLGRKVTAYLSDADSARMVGKWVKGTAQPRELTSQRLQSAYEVARVLVDAYGAKAARTWLFGMNPLLNDEAPAYVLRSGQRPEDWELVLPAAREFVET